MGEKMTPCAECGMPCEPGEYHPYAACLMFKGCHNSTTVRANLTQPAQAVDVDSLAQEIRRVDGNHSLGAGALAEALMPFIARALSGKQP